jgi:hypothetical protein
MSPTVFLQPYSTRQLFKTWCKFLFNPFHASMIRILSFLFVGDTSWTAHIGWISYLCFFETVTEPRKTKPRETELWKTEHRKTEPRMTKHRKGPNIERPNLEWDWTSKNWTSKLTERRKTERWKIELLKDWTSKRTEHRKTEHRKGLITLFYYNITVLKQTTSMGFTSMGYTSTELLNF